jgi:hypothetical protein
MNRSSSRQESDFLGTRNIPAAANFPISGQLMREKLTRPMRLGG